MVYATGPDLNREMSLCKIKVKPKHGIHGVDSRDLRQHKSEKEDVQQYVVASKKRTIVLQFESPVKKKNTKILRMKKERNDSNNAQSGVVQGIKNLSPAKHSRNNHKGGVSLIEKIRSGAQGLEGTYIHVDRGMEDIGSIGFESLDKNDLDMDYGYQEGEGEEEVVEVEKDDNYYHSFLRSIQCRVSVKNLKCDDDVFLCADKTNVPQRTPLKAKHDEAIEPMATKLLVNWSGEGRADMAEKIDNYHDNDVYEPVTNEREHHGVDVREDKSNHINGDYYDDDDGDDYYDDDIVERTPAKTDKIPVDSFGNFLLGHILYFNPCTNFGETGCENKFECGAAPMEIPQFEEDDMTEVSLEAPTALYAAIGTKNWNVALRRLIEAPEEASVWVSSGVSNEGNTTIEFLPLHLACLTKAPLLLVTLLVQTFPEAIERESMGKLPIHMACEAKVDHRIVFLLLSQFPESLEMKDEDGNTPIALASLADSSHERGKIIQILTRNMENTVLTTPTALYHAIDSQDWNFAMRRLVEVPQESTMWVSFRSKKVESRFLPLHAACLMGAPLLLVEDLIQAYPDAVRKKTLQGKLPLHLACESLVDHRVIQLLLDHYQDAMYVKNFEGDTPIDIAEKVDPCPEKENIIEIFTVMMEKDEEKIVFVPTKLYSLIQKKKWDDAVRRVLEAPDEALTWVGANPKKTNVKCLPLHIACALRAPLIVIAVLVQSYADSVKKTTSTGKLPLHVACEKGADHRVISFLIHSWPDSFNVKDSTGQTCVQSALLAKPGDQKTKNLEALMAFESKGGKPLTVEGLKIVEDENLGNLETNNNIIMSGIEDPAISNTDTIRRDEDKTNNPKKQTYYTKRNRFFGRKKKKTLWKSDEEMFQSSHQMIFNN